eukprot:scpid102273/ scgid0602/ 
MQPPIQILRTRKYLVSWMSIQICLVVICRGRPLDESNEMSGERALGSRHRLSRATHIQRGGVEKSNMPLALPVNDQNGHVVDANRTSFTFDPSKLRPETARQPDNNGRSTIPRILSAGKAVYELPEDDDHFASGSLPTDHQQDGQGSQQTDACAPKLKARKISYYGGCSGKLTLSVCQGTCQTQVDLKRTAPFSKLKARKFSYYG